MRLIVLLVITIVFASCSRDEQILPSQITKELRENLGRQIRNSILSSNEIERMPTVAPLDSTAYFYIQTLYNQATNRARLDRLSPSDNRWSVDREWEVHILNDEAKNIFIIPGGDLFLTKGLLKSLRYESELYYLLAYEVCLMNGGCLLKELITRYGTNSIYNIACEKDLYDKAVHVDDLALLMQAFELDEEVTRDLDVMTAKEICSTSVMDRMSIVDILGYADEEAWEWLDYRKNYGNRIAYIQNLDMELDCGNFVTNGNYERYVLSVLD